MHRPLTARTASSIKIGKLIISMDDGKITIQTPNEKFSLSGQETHRLLNLLMDYRVDVVAVSTLEQKARESKGRPAKPMFVEIDGKQIEAAEISDLEAERDQ